jgi:hypothetical protein
VSPAVRAALAESLAAGLARVTDLTQKKSRKQGELRRRGEIADLRRSAPAGIVG